jgi:hypothetical protein
VALSPKTAGTWARLVVDGTVAIPGSPAAGDRMFLFASWKDWAITVAQPSGWTLIGTEFADGTVNAGVSTGSVKVMAWYRDWQSGDTAPTVDWSANPTEGHVVIMLWQKAAADIWDTPLTVTAGIAAADPFTVNASSTVDVPSGGVVMGLIGLRDDSATIARATDAIDDTGALVTWNGNYVENPSGHFTSTTGQDMSGDLGHRLVTTGAAGVTLHMDGDPAAAETGAAKFVVQGVHTDTTVTPDVASLTTATFAPTVTATQNQLITPDTLALTATTFAPAVTATDHKVVTPGIAALVTTTFAPVVGLGVIPGTVALTLAAFAPAVSVSDNVTVTPGVASLVTATFAPTVLTPVLSTPDVIALVLTTFASTIGVSDNIVVTPAVTALALSAFAPDVTVGGGSVVVTPGVAALVLTAFSPTVVATATQIGSGVARRQRRFGIEPMRFAPTLIPPSQHVTVMPAAASIALTTFAPTVIVNDDDLVLLLTM